MRDEATGATGDRRAGFVPVTARPIDMNQLVKLARETHRQRPSPPEFYKIWPFAAIFLSIPRANSNGYSQISYATEQGIFAAITGNFLQ
jgi:hypothetical protein